MMKWLGYCLLAAGLGAAQAQGEAIVVKRPAELREAPGDASRSLATLAAQTPVTRQGERQGAWVQVKTAQGATGWVHMFDLGAAGGAAPGGNAATGALRSITNFFNKGSAQAPLASPATSTVGIRGLGAEDLAQAQPNLAAVGQAEALRLDAGQARQFASLAALSAQAVEPLPIPAAPRAATQRGGAPGNPEMP
ncbi:SH3 domain-containing protein [Variovorax terrae]|uniref:SH3 domain-containing protein n=1 Tax=Variovorax terrae TaxID=2923278 RepID=A0A9X2ASD6_9BURK|nr:SH3 domain-containing protein [Variovorax terrae]MCJ0765231.1 SH3 domain-containing protein [Variovorax terrae]